MVKRGFVSLAALTVAVAPMLVFAPAHAEPGAPEKSKIQFVLDSSGSMAAKDKAGRPKIDAAREALHKMTDTLDPQANVGLRVYGATVKEEAQGGKLPANACTDTQKVVDFGTNNRAELHAAIDRYTPTGFTPTVQAVKASLDDLGTEGKRHIVLVSDGEANCSPNPCDEIKALQKPGVTFQVDTVGMSLNDKARAELKCIATATGGTYYDTTNTEELTNSLDRITKRAIRAYDFQGTPVQGATDPAQAPMITPGQYLDRLGHGETKYYRVSVPEGQNVHVGATRKPAYVGKGHQPDINVSLLNESHKVCSTHRHYENDAFGWSKFMVSAGATYDTVETARWKWCPPAKDLLVKVRAEEPKEAPEFPVELLVTTTPAINLPVQTVRDRDLPSSAYLELPSAWNRFGKLPEVKPAATTRQIVGGSSFNNAVELPEGPSQDTMVLGETLVYKVKLDWGQSAVLVADAPIDREVDVVLNTHNSYRDVLFTRAAPGQTADATRIGGKYREQFVTSHVPEVRANNRFSLAEHVMAASEPGYYYFVVNVNGIAPGDAEVGTATVPIRLNLAIGGKAGEGDPSKAEAGKTLEPSVKPSSEATAQTAEPTPVAPTAEASPVTADKPEGGSKLPIVLGLGGAGLAITAGGGVWLASRMRG